MEKCNIFNLLSFIYTSGRDHQLPHQLDLLRRREVLLQQFGLGGPEAARRARNNLFGTQNGRKARLGALAALQSPAILEGKVDFSFGCRFMKESDVENYKFSFFRVMGNRIVNRYLSFLGHQRFYDITTGFKAWTRRGIKDIAFKDDGFIYEVEIAIRANLKGYKVKMIPITYFNRLGGISGHGRGWQEPISITWTGIKILVFATLIRLSLR